MRGGLSFSCIIANSIPIFVKMPLMRRQKFCTPHVLREDTFLPQICWSHAVKVNLQAARERIEPRR